jgi:hypothetical protein
VQQPDRKDRSMADISEYASHTPGERFTLRHRDGAAVVTWSSTYGEAFWRLHRDMERIEVKPVEDRPDLVEVRVWLKGPVVELDVVPSTVGERPARPADLVLSGEGDPPYELIDRHEEVAYQFTEATTEVFEDVIPTWRSAIWFKLA